MTSCLNIFSSLKNNNQRGRVEWGAGGGGSKNKNKTKNGDLHVQPNILKMSKIPQIISSWILTSYPPRKVTPRQCKNSNSYFGSKISYK